MAIAIILDSEDVSYYAFRAYLYSKVGDNTKAQRDCQKILESDTIPNVSSIAMYAYQGLGEDAKAIDFMNSVGKKRYDIKQHEVLWIDLDPN